MSHHVSKRVDMQFDEAVRDEIKREAIALLEGSVREVSACIET